MHTHKLSISLPEQQYTFLEKYKQEHNVKSRSEVIPKAPYLLQQMPLEASYKEANVEINRDFDVTNSDRLDDETR